MASFSHKSSIDDIRRRFDAEVERFSNLETGQQAAMDSRLMMDLIAAVSTTRLQPGMRVLDLGCGAGNLTLSVLSQTSPLDCVLVDLSQPMLERAAARVGQATSGTVETIQSDMRRLTFSPNTFDVILAAAVLHHLRDDADWRAMFECAHRWLRQGGLLLVADLVTFDEAAIEAMMQERYGQYLEGLGGVAYRDKVFAYVDAEDSPRSLSYQLDLLREVGFRDRDVLHRNSLFAAFYAVK